MTSILENILTECGAVGFMELFYVVPANIRTPVASYKIRLELAVIMDFISQVIQLNKRYLFNLIPFILFNTLEIKGISNKNFLGKVWGPQIMY